MGSSVHLRNLRKNYGTKEAVCGIDLEIQAGELFVLVGANGAGKTSTLKMLVGLLKPTSGTVQIGQWDFKRHPQEAKKSLAFVPDVPYAYDKLTPWEFLRFIGNLHHLKPELIESRGKELIRFFDLEEAQHFLMEEFSHGMRQKAVLAASLIHEPAVLVLDEPMVGLDPISILSFKNLLKKKTQEGTTVIFSTHTLSMAEELADRLAIVDHGKIVAEGSLAELHQKFHSQENLEKMFMRLIAQEPR